MIKNILENKFSRMKKLAGILSEQLVNDEPYCLVTHQDFKIIKEFPSKPTDEEIESAVSDYTKHKVIDGQYLDRENILFHTDGGDYEFLLRKKQYC